jgi:hypothetical protein
MPERFRELDFGGFRMPIFWLPASRARRYRHFGPKVSRKEFADSLLTMSTQMIKIDRSI